MTQGRHVALLRLIDAGLPPKTVQTFAGPPNPQVTMNRYGHLFRSEPPAGYGRDWRHDQRHHRAGALKNQNRNWSDFVPSRVTKQTVLDDRTSANLKLSLRRA